ncbi:glutathione S-transferase [Nemania sp. NC0429]|nr:glutathione S-transferase [Nemania sp. NC0429]
MAAETEGKPTLLHLDNSQSQTILWLLEELEIPYDIKFFERGKSGANKGRAPESLKETHPLGKSPQLITASGRVIVERSAISAYLIDTYDSAGKFKVSGADDAHDLVRENELVGFAEASFYAMAMPALLLHFLGVYAPLVVRPLTWAVSTMLRKGMLDKEFDSQLKYMNNILEGQEFFMSDGNPTRVDFVMIYFVQTLYNNKVIDIAPYANVKAWFERCFARPAWKRSIEKGNGFSRGV